MMTHILFPNLIKFFSEKVKINIILLFFLNNLRQL